MDKTQLIEVLGRETRVCLKPGRVLNSILRMDVGEAYKGLIDARSRLMYSAGRTQQDGLPDNPGQQTMVGVVGTMSWVCAVTQSSAVWPFSAV